MSRRNQQPLEIRVAQGQYRLENGVIHTGTHLKTGEVVAIKLEPSSILSKKHFNACRPNAQKKKKSARK